MDRLLIPRRIIALLIAGAIVFPIAICLIIAVSSLLVTMSDQLGGRVLLWIALGCGIVWILDLILLILSISINLLTQSNNNKAEADD